MRYLCVLLALFLFAAAHANAGWNQYDTAYVSSCVTSSHSTCTAPPAGSFGEGLPWRQIQTTTAQCGNADGSFGTQTNFSCQYNAEPCASPAVWDQPSQSCQCPAGQELLNGQCVASCLAGQIRDSSGQCVSHCTFDGEGVQQVVTVSGKAGRGSDAANQCIGGCGFVLVDTLDIGGQGNCVILSGGQSKCTYIAKGTGQSCTAGTGSGSAADVVTTPQTTPASSNTTTNTSDPVQTKPPGTVPSQSGTTVEVSSSSSSTVNPDGTVTTQTTTTTTTTNPDGSQTVSTVHGTSTQQGGNGKGAGSGSGKGTGDGTGIGDCDPTSKDYLNCMAGDQTPTDHTAGDAQTFGDALNNFQTGLKATPIGQLASSTGIGGSVNVGSCPTATFDLFGHSVVMNAHCQIFDSISPTLTTMMHVVYIVMGILIILSA